MSEYLLSSQGDRMLSAHSIEGRFPFLDHRVIEFASQIPPELKIRGLNEKYVLKRAMCGKLPDTVRARPKRPYRAPIHRAFFNVSGQPATEGHPSNGQSPEYVHELLLPEAIQAGGYFEPQAVSRLVEKTRSANSLSERDNMALAGILSTQLLHEQFIDHFPGRPSRPVAPLKVCVGAPLLLTAE